MNNIIIKADSYKASHWKQYPPKTTGVYSYFESRGGMYKDIVFFGLQYYLKKYLAGQVVSYDKINEAKEFFKAHLGNDKIFNYEGWSYIVKKYDGKLPIEIKAVLEGTIVPTQNVLFTIENTDPECFWLTSYLETLLSKVWYPSTVATKSWYQKQVIKKYLKDTGDDIPDFKLHDFGYRGSTSEESAAIGGAAHLVNFKGTDTTAGIVMAQKYYGAEMPAFSIPAAEHSTITAWGKDHEVDAFENMLDQFPDALVAVVSDSYDIFKAVEEYWGEQLKEKVVGRNGVLIIRPDSGDPADTVLKVINILGEKFGHVNNKKGYKVLPPYLRMIQGDGIDEVTLPQVLNRLMANDWSADNLAFGSGGGLLQNINRDTCKFAFKTSSVTVDGKERDVYKDPVTDPGKKSKKGKLGLFNIKNTQGNIIGWHTQAASDETEAYKNQLQTVFRDGELLIDQAFEDIRKRSNDK